MTLLPDNTRLPLLLGFIGWLGMGCAGSPAIDPTPESGCRIQQSVAVSTSKFYDETARTTYNHDASGKLLKTETTTDKKLLNGATGPFDCWDLFGYNSAGQ